MLQNGPECKRYNCMRGIVSVEFVWYIFRKRFLVKRCTSTKVDKNSFTTPTNMRKTIIYISKVHTSVRSLRSDTLNTYNIHAKHTALGSYGSSKFKSTPPCKRQQTKMNNLFARVYCVYLRYTFLLETVG